MKIKPQVRDLPLQLERKAGNTEVYQLSFSSEHPVERWFGTEILLHDDKAPNLERLNAGGPLLFNHNIDDVVGVVERAWVDKKRGHAEVRFAKNARGIEVRGLVDDKVLRNVSFAYRINELVEDPKKNEARISAWEALEISIVSVPADTSVGVGRAETGEEREVKVFQPAASAASTGATQMAEGQAAAGAIADLKVTDNGLQERLRITTITKLAATHKIADEQRDAWINEGKGAEEAAQAILDTIAERAKKQVKPTELDLSTGDVKRFSLLRGILAAHDKNWTKAGFEAETSRAIAQRLGTTPDPHKFYVPLDIQRRTLPTAANDVGYQLGKRDLTVASAAAGGYLVGTENLSFIELLRNRSVMYNMGARAMSGLVGNVTIPKHTGAATAYWLATEATGITESQQTFGQLALTPKTVGAYTEISRLLALQSSPDAEGIVNADLAAQIALAVDTAGLNGTGAAGQPTGVIPTAGIGSVTGTSIAYAGVLEFQTDCAASNALFGTAGYVTTPAVAALLMQRVKFASTASPLWDGNVLNGSVTGLRAMSSNQLPAANILFGAFDQVVIGEWGVLEVEVNPYANFQAGIMGVRAMYTIDVGVRYAAAFSLATAVT